MISVAVTDRRSPVLARSSLPCLRQTATINLTAGCAHGCLYCYTRGYRHYPGDGRVTLYRNALERLRDELGRQRDRLAAVYLSPSSDLFQPVPQVLEMTYQVLAFLLERGIPIAFLTKGRIPNRHMQLLSAHAPLVHAQVGLVTLADEILHLFEPRAADAQQRLRQIRELIQAGIETGVRVDPILPGFTDDQLSLRRLVAEVTGCGVKALAASTLFLRPAVTAGLRRGLPAGQFTRLVSAFAAPDCVRIRPDGGWFQAMSTVNRRRIYDRLGAITAEFGIRAKICACKNPGFAAGACGIAGEPPVCGATSLPLFPDPPPQCGLADAYGN